MSLVGPRPERPEFVGALRAEHPRATPTATASSPGSPAGRRCNGLRGQDLARRPRRVRQLLHRELVALVGHQDPPADAVRGRALVSSERGRNRLGRASDTLPAVRSVGVAGCFRKRGVLFLVAVRLKGDHPREGGSDEVPAADSSGRHPDPGSDDGRACPRTSRRPSTATTRRQRDSRRHAPASGWSLPRRPRPSGCRTARR